jgi:hypothetical protein
VDVGKGSTDLPGRPQAQVLRHVAIGHQATRRDAGDEGQYSSSGARRGFAAGSTRPPSAGLHS